MKLLLQGVGTSSGTVTGKVRIVEKGKLPFDFTDGDILVTRLTDPTMVPWMIKAAGIICDIGGITSHPSIVSRELGIPCIVATKVGTTTLQEGQMITMNGETGEIYE